MNNLKSSITLSLFFLCMLGSTQAFAENVKVNIGKIDKGVELIIFDNFEDTGKADHINYCNFDVTRQVPAYIRINGSKIQPVCWQPARTDGVGYVIPLGEGIEFNEKQIKFRDAVLDIDKKKIR